MPREIIIVLTSIGAVQSLFLAIFVLASQRFRHWQNVILGGLFLSLSIRAVKSLLWAYWPGTPDWFINFGFAAHALSAPLLLLYVQRAAMQNQPFQNRWLLHLTPPLFLFGGVFYFTLFNFWYAGGYEALLYYHLVYVTLVGVYLAYFKFMEKPENVDFRWLFALWLGVTLFGFTYFSNYILGATSYMLGPMAYSAIIYSLSFYILISQKVLQKPVQVEKYRHINVEKAEAERYRNKVYEVMNTIKPYLAPDFSLGKLADETGIPSYRLSHLINDDIGQRFADFTNGFRIEEAKSRLRDPDSESLKISTIAHDCGFNSISAFNSAFKKLTGQTPSQFKKTEQVKP